MSETVGLCTVRIACGWRNAFPRSETNQIDAALFAAIGLAGALPCFPLTVVRFLFAWCEICLGLISVKLPLIERRVAALETSCFRTCAFDRLEPHD